MNNSELEIEKVKGEMNRADALTKYKDGESIKRQLDWTNQVITSGRHSIAPKMSVKKIHWKTWIMEAVIMAKSSWITS